MTPDYNYDRTPFYDWVENNDKLIKELLSMDKLQDDTYSMEGIYSKINLRH